MKAWSSLLVLQGLAAAYIVLSSSALPARVAARFASGGAPSGYTSRDAYVALMLALAALVPLLIAGSAWLMRRLPARLVNVPNRDHWLAPERREATLAWIGSRMALFAHGVLLFMVFAHWLVLEAHEADPPRLPEGLFFAGLAIFVAATVLFAAVFHFHFRFRRRA